ncbi:hypothetical protein [Herbiconiux solani]|uniref:hypothetical protein n=1 Tax=Herbiconiux solani TaxID=661329 RepID=UPI0008263599|nr:hypothetical protein [Herbiconiux solani]
MLFLARGIEDDHYWVVREIDGALVETPWRVEHETAGYVLSHADDASQSRRGFELGAFETAEQAIAALKDSGLF